MFARTPRLLLRPGFAEDARALADAMSDQHVLRNLATAPARYGLADARVHRTRPADPGLPRLLIFERTSNAPRLVGACGLGRRPSGAIELGYWVARPHWGRGIATEAGAALVDIARALRLPSLDAAHFVDNPKSGRVLEKLGFKATGIVAPRMSCARGEEVAACFFTLAIDTPAEISAEPGEAEVLAA